MKINQEVNELDLIKKYQENPNDEIALYFYEKFKESALNIISSKINNKFSSVPLERCDFYNTIWKSVKSALANFNEKKSSSFFTFLVSNSYWLGLREASKFITNKHIVLNNAYSYERLLEKGIVNNNDPTTFDTYKQATKKFIESVIEFNTKYKKEEVSKVIYLKSLGYTISEIQKITKYPIHLVRGILEKACNIAKKIYE